MTAAGPRTEAGLAAAVLGLGLLLSPTTVAAATEPELAAEPTSPRIELVLLDTDPPLRDALADALSLRLGHVTITPYEGTRPAADAGLHAYVHVPPPRDEHYRVELIVSDGRAYAREVVASATSADRVLGGELALLLRGIEEGTLVPDRHDAVIPDADDGDPVAPDHADVPVPVPAPSDTVPPDDGAAHAEAPTEAPDDPERLELGMFAGAGGLLGIAPATDIGRSGAATGELGLELRWASGAAITADVRVGGRRPTPFSIVRTRIAAGGGIVLRRGAFELPLRLRLTLEPWGVRADGRGTPVMPRHGSARQVPLLGVAARADPGVRLSIAGHPSRLLRLGPFVELAASAVWSDGVGVPRLLDADTGDVVARLGGLELALGVAVELWLGLGRSPPRNRPSPATP